jgi:hypothetical protein
MAVGVEFEGSNAVLGAPTPEDAAAGTVYGLPVMRYRDLDGMTNVLSCWELTPEEMIEVILTGKIWFNAWGATHAPIWITGHDPRSKT